MVALVAAATGVVEMVNVAVVEPAATVKVEGTVAEPLLLDRATIIPPAGAAPLRVTAPVEMSPPATLVGTSVSDEGITGGGLIARDAVVVTPPYVAETVAVVTAVTAVVVTVNVAVVTPAATAMLAGTVAEALVLESVTTAPPTGATALSVTVPVEVAPPTSDVGASARLATVTGTGLIVRIALCVAPP
jgi:hypothetical protein